MEAIMFKAITKEGTIEIPKKFLSQIPDNSNVIIIIEKNVSLKKSKKKLTSLNVDTKNFKFNRDDIYGEK